MHRPLRQIDAVSPGGRVNLEAHHPDGGSRRPPTSFEGRMPEDLLNDEQFNEEDAYTGDILVLYMIW